MDPQLLGHLRHASSPGTAQKDDSTGTFDMALLAGMALDKQSSKMARWSHASSGQGTCFFIVTILMGPSKRNVEALLRDFPKYKHTLFICCYAWNCHDALAADI